MVNALSSLCPSVISGKSAVALPIPARQLTLVPDGLPVLPYLTRSIIGGATLQFDALLSQFRPADWELTQDGAHVHGQHGIS